MLSFGLDKIGILFIVLISFIWLFGAIYSIGYFKEEERKMRFFSSYILSYFVLVCLVSSNNLITFYLFYEIMTIVSAPLVFYNRSKESIMAGLKYMIYSFFGAYLVLFGIFILYSLNVTLQFNEGGVLTEIIKEGNKSKLLLAAFLIILGFSVKAEMFPFHNMVTTAHPVITAPASAFISAIVAKAGVLGIIRVVFYIFGANYIRGTWVQSAWIGLTLLTIFMGSMIAYFEKNIKKRLAYSTISQISYILFGLALLTDTSYKGSILHIFVHAIIKTTLFFVVGCLIEKTDEFNVDRLAGVGNKHKVIMGCFIISSLALVGIPPLSGFFSKWYLAIGSLESNLFIFDLLGPVVLLISAFLTAGYLLPFSIKAFMRNEEKEVLEIKKIPYTMTIPIILLTIATILFGLVANIIRW